MAKIISAMTEAQIQSAVFREIRTRGMPGLVAFHPRNSGRDQRNAKTRAINWNMGVETGASDVIAFYDEDFFALEIKDDVGQPTPKQLEFLSAVEAAGGNASWQRGLRNCIHQLERWGLLRGAMA